MIPLFKISLRLLIYCFFIFYLTTPLHSNFFTPSLSLELEADLVKGTKILSSTTCYTVEKKIGEGSFGKVYLVKDSLNNHKFAIKCYKDSSYPFFFVDPAREFGLGRTLNHDHIIKSIDYFSNDDHNYLVLEYADGKTIADLPKANFTKKEAKIILLQIHSALFHAFSLNLIQLDLHLRNIMISNEGVKLIDLASFFNYEEMFEWIFQSRSYFFSSLKSSLHLIQNNNDHKNRSLFLTHYYWLKKLTGYVEKSKALLKYPNPLLLKQTHDFFLEKIIYTQYFEDITDLFVEVLKKTKISTQERIQLRIELKKRVWEYEENIEKDNRSNPTDFLRELEEFLSSLEV